MKEIVIEKWADFEAALQNLDDEISPLPKVKRSQLLFRGQQNKKLKTTLDRYVNDKISLVNYYNAIFFAKPQIETFTGQTWNIPCLKDYTASIKNRDKIYSGKYFRDHPQIYEYMAYLRHHGFPSPLLDWTKSPYVAAFFAYNNFTEKTDKIAIYAYLEYGKQGKSTSSDEPWITPLEPYINIKTHQRHFLQQSNYTICTCTTLDTTNNDRIFYYAKHEDVFKKGEDRQDVLWKFILPTEDRIIALRKLDKMNINAYSLFGSEESLMSTMALRTFKL